MPADPHIETLRGHADSLPARWMRDEAHRAIDALTARLEAAERDLADTRKALRLILMAEPTETERGTAWPSFAGHLQNIAGSALTAAQQPPAERS